MIRFVPGEWIGLHEIARDEFNALRKPAEKAILKAALHLEGAIERTLTGSRSGRIYRVGKRGRVHRASAPGEPPAVLYGKLRQSITHIGPTWNGDEVSAEVGSKLPYAARLEFGGIDSRGVRILPRPYIAPTVLAEQDRMEEILEEAGNMMWDEVMERAFALIQDDAVLVEIFGDAMRMAGTGDQQVPGLEWSLVGDTEGELWAPILVQFDVWSEDMSVVTRAERRLRAMFHKDLPSTLGELVVWMQFTDGAILTSPDRSGFNGRAIRFRFTPLRRQYALRESQP